MVVVAAAVREVVAAAGKVMEAAEEREAVVAAASARVVAVPLQTAFSGPLVLTTRMFVHTEKYDSSRREKGYTQ